MSNQVIIKGKNDRLVIALNPDIDFLNDVNIFPIDSPNSGSRLGPKIRSAARTNTITPGAPISRKNPILVTSFFINILTY